MRRDAGALIATSLALVLAGCGSTVQVGAADSLSGDGSGLVVGPGSTDGSQSLAGGTGIVGPGGATGPGTGSVTGPGTTSGGGYLGGGPTGGTQGPGAGVVNTPLATAPGVTKDSILIGIEKVQGQQANPLGATGTENVDVNAVDDALLKYINTHGGVAGRQLKPVVYTADASNPADTTAEDKECQKFATDNRVFAALTMGPGDTLHQCLANHGVAHIGARGIADWDNADFKKQPDFVETSSFSYDEVGQILGDGMADSGYFGKWDTTLAQPSTTAELRIGILAFDGDKYQAGADALEAALHRHGLKKYDRIAVSYDPSSTGQDVAGAVLKFRNENITHVMFISNDGVLPYLFGISASQQKYYPRLSMTSQDAPGLMPQQNGSENSWNGSMGVGWFVDTDVLQAQDPGTWPARKQCNDILHAAGIKHPSRVAEAEAGAICDEFFFFKAAFEKAPVLTRHGFALGAEALKGTWSSAVDNGNIFSPGRHRGGNNYRLLGYFGDCKCFKYTSSFRRLFA